MRKAVESLALILLGVLASAVVTAYEDCGCGMGDECMRRSPVQAVR